MTLREFWDHIEKTKRREPDEHFERLVGRLAKLRVVDIVDCRTLVGPVRPRSL